MIQLYKCHTNKYDVNFKLKFDNQSVLEMPYDTRGNGYKLGHKYSADLQTGNRYFADQKLADHMVHKLRKYELTKQFFVNRVVKLWIVLSNEVVSVSSVSSFKRHLDGFWFDRDLYLTTKSTCSTVSNNVIIVLVKFLL